MKKAKVIILSIVLCLIIGGTTMVGLCEENIVVKNIGFGIIGDGNRMYQFTSQSGEPLPMLEYKDSIYVPVRSFCRYVNKGIDWSPPNEICIFSLPANVHEGKVFGEEQRIDDYKLVSIIELIAYPEKYDGKNVTIRGVINVGYESNLIFITSEDYRYSIRENSIGWKIPIDGFGVAQDTVEFYDVVGDISGTYVEMSGTFKASPDWYPRGYLRDLKCIACRETLLGD